MMIQFIYEKLKILYLIILTILGLNQQNFAEMNTYPVYENVGHEVHAGVLNGIRFTEMVVYGESEDVMFGNILTSAVGPSGRVYLGDMDQQKIHVLDTNGDYITSFGGQGNGPGEFQMINKIAVNQEYVFAFDMIQARIHLFEPGQYRFVRTISLLENDSGGQSRMTPGEGRPFDFYLTSDNNLMVSFRNFMDPTANRIAVISAAGEVIDRDRFDFTPADDENVVQRSSGGMVMVANFPFSRTSRMTASGSGMVYYNWSGNFSFDQFDESGNKLQSFSHPFTHAPLIRREVIEAYEGNTGTRVVFGSGPGGGGGGGAAPSMSAMLQNMDLPETWPAVSSLFTDKQNRLWVSTFTEKMDERRWYLFDPSGNLLGNFTWPNVKTVVYADGEYVYTLIRDPEELDVLVKYRMH